MEMAGEWSAAGRGICMEANPGTESCVPDE